MRFQKNRTLPPPLYRSKVCRRIGGHEHRTTSLTTGLLEKLRGSALKTGCLLSLALLMSFLIFSKEAFGSPKKMTHAEQLAQLSDVEKFDVTAAGLGGGMFGSLIALPVCMAGSLCLGVHLEEVGAISEGGSFGVFLLGTIAGSVGGALAGTVISEKAAIRTFIKRKNSCQKTFTHYTH